MPHRAHWKTCICDAVFLRIYMPTKILHCSQFETSLWKVSVFFGYSSGANTSSWWIPGHWNLRWHQQVWWMSTSMKKPSFDPACVPGLCREIWMVWHMTRCRINTAMKNFKDFHIYTSLTTQRLKVVAEMRCNQHTAQKYQYWNPTIQILLHALRSCRKFA